ncbi:nSTAND1 domain-containing NTPase [Streptomyces echinatus]|uniref:WD40 repeat protein/DNA-binding XRE family transcriptional regulator n=1 Tax=Streptomyces echinatus TaxID=67293 RepID=A0A7W9Q1F0_9ACTN|nr:helix-turn-helix domain-containing protein [Streptomyces echinatus]MBB5931864.1 WD40 repeat protein/DNA-binding XRE family transcriptional regulator [Streptomyces echinatus]
MRLLEGAGSVAGRREVPVDPAAGPAQRFAQELRKLRQETGGLTYRVMAQRVEYSVTTLSQAAAGQKLPSLEVTLAYVRACGGDEDEWRERWRQAAALAAAVPGEGSGTPPPYRGLARFEPVDAKLFFGRERLTSRLLNLSRDRRFTAVFGPSGSGKSSLLRAGLIPRLREGIDPALRPAAIRVLTPGEHPVDTHASRLIPVPDTDGDTWLIVDQFEELFTLCRDATERTDFINRLLTSLTSGSRLRVVAAVRADFYAHCLEHPGLTAVLRDATVPVGQMSREELREAIVGPAAAAGLVVERALTARLLNDVEGEPGALPMLSHALLETWRHRTGRTLTESTYEAAGTLHGAIAKTAEGVYNRFTESEAHTARRLLLRLVTPGDGAPDTRRPAERAELQTTSGQATAQVLEALSAARLLTFDNDTVDLAHETLLTAWPRLRGWIETDRERLRAHRKLTEAARVWEELARDPGALYRGTLLDTAQEHFAGGSAQDLTVLEHDFLVACLTAREQEQHRAARTARKLRRSAVALSVLLVLSLIAGLTAFRQSQFWKREQLRAEARRIAALADGIRFEDPKRAMLLSVAAWRLADLPETRSTLLAAAWQKEADAFTVSGGDPAAGQFLDLDGRTVISAGRKRVRQWDVSTHRQLASFAGLGAYADDYPEVSPESHTAVLNSDSGVRLWNLAEGRPAGRPPVRGAVGQMSPSGRTVIVYGADHSVQLREIASGRLLLERRAGAADGPVRGKASPDDRLLALCRGSSARLEVYDTNSRRELTAAQLSKARSGCRGLQFSFSRDSRALLTLTADKILFWEVASGKLLHTVGHPGTVEAVLSPDGQFLAAIDPDEILVWRVRGPAGPVFRHSLVGETASSLRWAPGGRTLRYLAGLHASTVRTLQLGPVVDFVWSRRPHMQVAFTEDGNVLTTAHSSPDGDTVLFGFRDLRSGRLHRADMHCPAAAAGPDAGGRCHSLVALTPDGRMHVYGVTRATGSRQQTTLVAGGAQEGRRLDIAVSGTKTKPIRDIEVSPDGRLLYLPRSQDDRRVTDAQFIADDQRLEIWDLHRRKRVRVLPGVGGDLLALRPDGRLLVTSSGQVVDLPSGRVTRRVLSQDTVRALSFSSDGKHLAVGDAAGRVTVWDSRVRRRTFFAATRGGTAKSTTAVSALAFSPDGRTLAAGTRDTIQLWDTASPQQYGFSLPSTGDTPLSMAFTPDGRRLSTAGGLTPLYTYVTDPHWAADRTCRRAGRTLSRAEWKAALPRTPYRNVCQEH